MRTEKRTVRIGENVGPVDWSYDFRSHFTTMGTSEQGKDEACARSIAQLRTIVAAVDAGRPIHVTTDGGSPKGGYHPVGEVGMYDGWPYWRPVPSVFRITFLGGEWVSFRAITDTREPALQDHRHG